MERPGAIDELVPLPRSGRVFSTTRRVRFGDTDRFGRLRLDALARTLQDVGNDDFLDAGLDPSSPWVARRTVVAADPWPQLGERLSVATWCGGLGSRWAERRSSIRGDAGGSVEVATLWVHVDADGRPARLPGWFVDTYADATLGRTVSSRLFHGPPPGATAARPWPVRSTDVDVLGHVNNAATWAAVEDECARWGVLPARAELEYLAAIAPDDDVVLRSVAAEELRMWLVVGGAVAASALVRPGVAP